jgi:1-acyl-sn-glycerol-3-phosphate acyltransferase
MNLSYASLMLMGKAYQALLPQDCMVFGADHLPQGAKIVAANHPNWTDTLFLARVIKEPLHTLTQGALFDIPLYGRLLTASGQIPVYPGQGGAALQRACECLAKSQTVLIYPEAQWNPENKRLQGKSGAVRMSLSTGAPIIPLGIHVPDENTRWVRVNDRERVRQARWQIKGRCYLCFGDPWLPPAAEHGEVDPGRIHTLTDQLMDKIYDQARRAMLESRLDAPAKRGSAGIGLAGIRLSESHPG